PIAARSSDRARIAATRISTATWTSPVFGPGVRALGQPCRARERILSYLKSLDNRIRFLPDQIRLLPLNGLAPLYGNPMYIGLPDVLRRFGFPRGEKLLVHDHIKLAINNRPCFRVGGC